MYQLLYLIYSLAVSHDTSLPHCTTTVVSEEHTSSSSSHDSKPKKNRCHVCRKKLGLTGKQLISFVMTKKSFCYCHEWYPVVCVVLHPALHELLWISSIVGFDCRCGGVYCSLHRYSDTHECTFDYKTTGRQEIAKNNPVVIAPKIQKL